MRRKKLPRFEDTEHMRRGRERGKIRAAIEGTDAKELEADRATNEAVSRGIKWARRQYVLSRPDLSPILKDNLING